MSVVKNQIGDTDSDGNDSEQQLTTKLFQNLTPTTTIEEAATNIHTTSQSVASTTVKPFESTNPLKTTISPLETTTKNYCKTNNMNKVVQLC